MRIVTLLVLVFALGAPRNPAPVGDPSVAGLLASAGATYDCRECLTWPSGGHTFTDDACFHDVPECFICLGPTGEDCSLEEYEPGPCAQHHTWCAETAPNWDALEQAVSNADAEAIWQLVSDKSQYVRINETRSALQLFDCKGNIFGQYRLKPTLHAEVATLQAG